MFEYDAIVIGLGGMGSAALYQLARRGVRALGIEQFDIAHNRGSSHGATRLIRRAYFEHPDYVPLVNRAYELWAELEQRSGKKLFHRTGLALFGPRHGEILPNVMRAAEQHRLNIETIVLDQAARRFPMFRLEATGMVRDRNWPNAKPALNPSWECLFEPDAGYLLVEECVRAFVEQAVSMGAVARTNESVQRWSATDRSVEVVTDRERYQANRIIVCAGPWSARLLAELSLPLRVLRKVVLWFEPGAGNSLRADQGCPVFGFDIPPESCGADATPSVESSSSNQPIEDGSGRCAPGFFYGFPVIDADGLKMSDHRGGEFVADPDQLDRELRPEDMEPLRDFVNAFVPGATDTVRRHSVCMYTMTPDEHFIVDRHPLHANVVFAAGFSGHGFKFAPVVGSVLADLALAGRTAEPVEFLRFNRPSLGPRNPQPSPRGE